MTHNASDFVSARPRGRHSGLRLLLLSTLMLTLWSSSSAVSPAQADQPAIAAPKVFKKFRQFPDSAKDAYFVILNDNVAKSRTPSLATSLTKKYNGKIRFVYQYYVHGFSAELTKEQAQLLSEDPQVKTVSSVGVGYGDSVQASPGWALDRIDQKATATDSKFTRNNNGTGIHIYIVDTGINSHHQEFSTGSGTRVIRDLDLIRSVPNTDPNWSEDDNGHGTAVASLAGGNTCGVANNVTLHSIKVANSSNYANTDNTIYALEWIRSQAVHPSIVNISQKYPLRTMTDPANPSGPPIDDPSFDNAIRGLIADGYTVVASAGNDNTNASNQSPARVDEAITVGASDDDDVRFVDDSTHGSNYGPKVDLFAPGVIVRQATGIAGNNTSIGTPSTWGTSYSAPLAAGTAALFLQTTPNASPYAVAKALKANATQGVVSNTPSGTTAALLNTTYACDPAHFFIASQLPSSTGIVSANGWCREANMNDHSQGFLIYGPYTTRVPVGANTATWRLVVDNNTNDDSNIVRLEVVDANDSTVLASRDISRKEFATTYQEQVFQVGFELPSARAGHMVELRCWWYDTSFVQVASSGLSRYEWQASDTQLWHPVGFADGDGYAGSPGVTGTGFLIGGPYDIFTETAWKEGTFRIMANRNTTGTSPTTLVARIEVRDQTSDIVIAARDLTRADFGSGTSGNTYTSKDFELPFFWDGSRFTHQIELRVWYYNNVYVRAQKVGLADSP
jgi:subtilisin family serine protease